MASGGASASSGDSCASDEAALLNAIVEGTVRNTGAAFFRTLVRHLAAGFDAESAFVARIERGQPAGNGPAGSPRDFAIMESVASPLAVDGAAVSRVPSRVRTIAFWSRGAIVDDAEWDLDGTPCEEVVAGHPAHHPRDVWKLFPRDAPLVEARIEGYLGVPLRDTAGRVLGHLAVFDRRPMEVGERRLQVVQIFAQRAAAELERLSMEARLRESERRFRDLFEEAPIPYVYEDTDSRFVSANRAFMELMGLRDDDVPGTLGLSLVAPSPENQALVHASLASEQAGREKGCIEIELRRKDDGRPVWVQRWSRPEPDGRHTRTMVVDITARVLAERERARLQQQNQYLQEEIRAERNFEEIVGASPPMRRVFRQIEQVAPTASTVLLLGETGTGKELIARAIHNLSPRRGRPLIKLNCAALPTGLVESELFGHEKGAFTGAVERRIGRFALADQGTIFLDEIGDMPLEVQVRLLRVLQEQEFEAVGSTRTTKVDVRVIAATNRDLARAVAEGAFRADLFYRLNVFPIAVPPLRDRASDIPLLVRYFAMRHGAKIGRRAEEVDERTMERLVAYPWPGNIRELENVIERAVILSPGPALVVDPETLRVNASATSSPGASPDTLAARERTHVVETLERTNWVIEGPRGAARILGLHPNTLRSRMRKLGIRRTHDPS